MRISDGIMFDFHVRNYDLEPIVHIHIENGKVKKMNQPYSGFYQNSIKTNECQSIGFHLCKLGHQSVAMGTLYAAHQGKASHKLSRVFLAKIRKTDYAFTYLGDGINTHSNHWNLSKSEIKKQ